MSILEYIKTNTYSRYQKDIWIIPIVILGFILTIYPHIDYPFLFHIDEWFHVAQAKQFAMGSEINWYTGDSFSLGMERAWHGFLAAIYLVLQPSMKHWMILPSILHALAIIATYIFVSRWCNKTRGVIASFFIAILPSNNTIGGPVYLIPVNLSLLIIPVALLFAFHLTRIKPLYDYVILIFLSTLLLYAHAPSAIVLLLIIFVKGMLLFFSKEKKDRREGLNLFLVLVSSAVLSLPNFINEIFSKGFESITFHFFIKLDEIFFFYGILPTIFFVIGFYSLSKLHSREVWTFLISALILFINIVVFAWFDINIFLPYQRTFIPLFLLMSIIGSVGVTTFLNIKGISKKIGIIIVSFLLLTTGAIAISVNLDYSYYRIIDETDYENAVWIKENTGIDEIMICDPWKARALAPTAERKVYAVSPFGPVDEEVLLVQKAVQFLENDCRNTSFLHENNISIVYTRGYQCYNLDLDPVKEDIYILK